MKQGGQCSDTKHQRRPDLTGAKTSVAHIFKNIHTSKELEKEQIKYKEKRRKVMHRMKI